MKKPKICDHCNKRFRNRQSLRFHLMCFHDVDRTLRSVLQRLGIRGHGKVPREGKPQRRIRMTMNAARRKKERDLVSRRAHNHGLQHTH